jgi:hypothetical protein
MALGFIAKDGTDFDELSSWYLDEFGQKILKVDKDKWSKLQRLLAYYDSMSKSDEAEVRHMGHEGRYAVERAIYIITEGWCNR